MPGGRNTNLHWPLQHFDPAYAIAYRRAMAAMRAHPPADADNLFPGQATYGSVEGGILTQEIPGQREYVHVWNLSDLSLTKTRSPGGGAGGGTTVGGPGGSGTGGSWSAAWKADWSADSRLQTRSPAVPAWSKWEVPVSWTAQLGRGTHEDSQEELLHPDAWGVVAANWNGPAASGSPVYDLDAGGAPDPQRYDHLQSVFSVGDLGPAPGFCGMTERYVGLQIGRGGKLETPDNPGYLMCVDHDKQVVGPFAADPPGALTLANGAGPLILPRPHECQHFEGFDPDGYAVLPGHVDWQALFVAPLRKDGPIAFELGFRPKTVADEGHWKKAHIIFDDVAETHTTCGKVKKGRWAVFYRDRWYTPPKIPRRKRQPPPRVFDPKDPEDTGDPERPRTGDDTIGFLPGHTVGTPVEGPPSYPHSAACVVLPGLIGHAFSTRDGEPDYTRGGSITAEDVLAAREARRNAGIGDDVLLPDGLSGADFQPSVADDLEDGYAHLERAPHVGGLVAWAAGDGTWRGFDVQNADDPDGYPYATSGGFVWLPPDVDLQTYMAKGSLSSVTNRVMHGGGSELGWGDLDQATGNVISGYIASLSSGSLDFTSYDANGAAVATIRHASDGHLRVDEIAAPGTPAAGKVAIYAKTDGKLYIKDDTGAETDLTAGGGGSPPFDDNTAILQDSADNTKKLILDVGNVATSTTITLAVEGTDAGELIQNNAIADIQAGGAHHIANDNVSVSGTGNALDLGCIPTSGSPTTGFTIQVRWTEDSTRNPLGEIRARRNNTSAVSPTSHLAFHARNSGGNVEYFRVANAIVYTRSSTFQIEERSLPGSNADSGYQWFWPSSSDANWYAKTDTGAVIRFLTTANSTSEINLSAGGTTQETLAETEHNVATGSGSSVSISNFFTSNKKFDFATSQITTTITGPTSVDLGTSDDTNLFGQYPALTSGSEVNSDDGTALNDGGATTVGFGVYSLASKNALLTANGGNFTGGNVQAFAAQYGASYV